MDNAATTRRDAFFAYAAGTVGAIANVALIVFYTLQANHPERGDALGALERIRRRIPRSSPAK